MEGYRVDQYNFILEMDEARELMEVMRFAAETHQKTTLKKTVNLTKDQAKFCFEFFMRYHQDFDYVDKNKLDENIQEV